MSNHPDPQDQPVKPTDDLERNPGIGQSQSLRRGEEPDGENTVEGDIENDAGPGGSIDPEQRGRDH